MVVAGEATAAGGILGFSQPVSSSLLAALLLAGLWLLLPGVLLGMPALPWFVATVFNADFPWQRHSLQVTVLDVGQGLAVTVETENHTLVYDSGNQFSEQFSTGSGIVAPYLWQRGRGQLEVLLSVMRMAITVAAIPPLRRCYPASAF